MSSLGLVIREPGVAEVREQPIPQPADDQILVEADFSAISAGTERMFFQGRVPAGTEVDTNLPGLSGRVSYPLRYGYSLVGRVRQVGSAVEPAWSGRRVFAFRPHQSHVACSPSEVVPLADDIDSLDAVLLATMETAINPLLDGAPLVGERAVVHGLGSVGLLTTALLAEVPLSTLIGVDPAPARRQAALDFGAQRVLDPGQGGSEDKLMELLTGEPMGADLSYELSGAPAALDLALASTGYAGRVVIGAWYGEESIPLRLGEQFHRSRLELVSSQVSTLNPRRRGRWTKERRLEVALAAVRRLRPSRLISHRLPIERADEAYALLDQPRECLQIVISYGDDSQ